MLKFLNLDPTGNKIKSLCLCGTSSLEQANKAFATPFRRTACGPRMANALLKITVFRRNIRMGKLNRQDKTLLQCNNSYSIKTNIKIFELMNVLYPTENYDDFQFQEVISNESFGFFCMMFE